MRDWLVLGLLLAGAVWAGWDQLAASPVGRYFAGACEARGSGRSFNCEAPRHGPGGAPAWR